MAGCFKFAVNFRFKGERDYVHGTDIYPAALSVIRERCGDYPREVTGVFHKLLKQQGVFLLDSRWKRGPSGDVYAHFAFRYAEKEYDLRLYGTGERITSTYAYDEGDVLCSSEMSGKTIRMIAREDYNYMEQIVAMTKWLHHNVYADVRNKWLFTRFQFKAHIDPAIYAGRVLKVHAERKLQNILSRCSISLDEELVGYIFFTAISEGNV